MTGRNIQRRKGIYMGLINYIAGKVADRLAGADGGGNRYLAAAFNAFELERGHRQPSNYTELVEQYSGWVYRCSVLKGDAVASVPLRLYAVKRAGSGKAAKAPTRAIAHKTREHLEKQAHLTKYFRASDNVEEVLDHPLLDLFQRVNPVTNRFDLLNLTSIFLDLTGNAYWYLPPNALGTPAEIWVPMAQRMSIIPDKEKFVSGYIYARGASKVRFETEEIVHFRGPNPKDILYGMGDTEGMWNTVRQEKFMEIFNAAVFANAGRLDSIVTIKGNPSSSEFNRFKREFNQNYGGPRAAGKTGFIRADTLDVKQLAKGPKDLDYPKGAEQVMIKVCSGFGVPVSLVVPDANRANSETGRYLLAMYGVRPRCIRIDEKINEQVTPRYDDRLFMAFDNPVPEDREFEMKERESNLNHGVWTINNVKAQMGEEPVPYGDTPWLPANLYPVGAALPPPEGAAASGGNGKALTVHPAVAAATERAVREAVAGVIKKNSEAENEENWKRFVARQGRYERQLAKAMRELFVEQRDEVLANMKRAPKARRLKQSAEAWMFGARTWTEKFSETFRPIAKAAMIDNGSRVMGDLPVVGVSFDVTSPEVAEFLNQYVPPFAEKVNAETARALSGTLGEGITEGEGMDLLRTRVMNVFAHAAEYRAQMIARTETIRASNAGAEASYIQSGVVEGKEWFTALDERVCEFCDPMHEQTMGLGEAFFAKGDRMSVTVGDKVRVLKFDYEEVTWPPLHPQCRCTLTAILR